MADKRIRSSDLRERVTLESNTPTYTKGERTNNWTTDQANIPADIRYETEHERVRAGRNEADQSVRVRIRNNWTVTPEKRISWNGDYWMVNGFPKSPDKKRRFLDFIAIRTDSD